MSNNREVLEEAAELLQKAGCHPFHVTHAEGRHAAVVVDPRRNPETGKLEIHIICQTFGGRQADWSGMGVNIRCGNLSWVPFFNARGNLFLGDLPEGKYQIAPVRRSVRSGVIRGKVLNQDRLAAANMSEPTRHILERGTSDGVTYTVEQTEDQELLMFFETDDTRVKEVEFRLIHALTSREESKGRLMFTPSWTAGRQKAECLLGMPPDGVSGIELLIEVIPVPDVSPEE
jgi:hypothetical protein